MAAIWYFIHRYNKRICVSFCVTKINKGSMAFLLMQDRVQRRLRLYTIRFLLTPTLLRHKQSIGSEITCNLLAIK